MISQHNIFHDSMMRRRLYKQSRQRFREIQESFREHARLSSKNSKNGDFLENEEEDSGASNRQHSPESVLFESEPSLYSSKLSPEIVLERPKARSPQDSESHVIDDASIVTQRIERSTSSRECRESDLLMYDLDIESRDDLVNLEKYPKLSYATILDDPLDLMDGSCSLTSLNNETQSSALIEETIRQSISLSARYLPFNLQSQSRDDSVPANSYEKRERRSLEENSNQPENRDLPETMDYNTLDKMFSMNDELMREMKSSSTIKITNESIMGTTELTGLSVCESIEAHDASRTDKERRKRTSNDNRRFNIVLEKIGERLSANWCEFRKMFAYLQRASRKIRGEDAECGASLLYKMFPYVSLSTSSSSSFCTPLSSPKGDDHRESSTDRGIATRFSLIDEGRKFTKSKRRPQKKEAKQIESKIQMPETPRSSSKCSFRNTTLTFDYEREVKKQKQTPEIRAEIADLLPDEKGIERSLDHLPSCEKIYWDHNVSESTLNLSTVSDGRSNSLQKVEYHRDDSYKRETSRDSSTQRDKNSHASRPRNICRALITWVIALCICLKRKLLHLLNSSYKKLQQLITSLSFRETPRTKKFYRLVTTLRSENEKMLRLLSKKVTRLSMDFAQIRKSTEATLNTLTIETNVIRETSRKMTEDNMTLMQELKKLRETLEEVRSKFSQPVSLSSSSSISRLPPPPPPPPPPPSFSILPPPPSLSLLPKVHTLELASSIPPPPPLPVASLQSPMSPIKSPTTPNRRSNKSRTPRKCSTPLFSRPSITVEDLLKVTLKKAPQSIKDSRRNTVPGPRGPLVSLDMLRNVKLKSAKRKVNDQTGKSPRSGRIVKNRTASSVNLSPILTGSEGNLERILRQVNFTRPRRLLSSSNSFRDRDFAKEMQSQSLQTLAHKSVLE